MLQFQLLKIFKIPYPRAPLVVFVRHHLPSLYNISSSVCDRISAAADIYMLVDCDIDSTTRIDIWNLVYYLVSYFYPNEDQQATRIFAVSTGHTGAPAMVHDATRYSSRNELNILENINNLRTTCNPNSRSTLTSGLNLITNRAAETGKYYQVVVLTSRSDSELSSSSSFAQAAQRIPQTPIFVVSGGSNTLASLTSQIILRSIAATQTAFMDNRDSIASIVCNALPGVSVVPVPTPTQAPPPVSSPSVASSGGYLRLAGEMKIYRKDF